MKKSLLTVLGASMLASFSYAQDVDTTYDVAWFDTLNSQFCVKVDPSNQVLGLKGLTASDAPWKWSTSPSATNSIEVANNKLTIVHTRLTTADNWTDVSLTTTEWVGGTSIKFGAKADTIAGMFVHMNEDVVVEATIQTDKNCNIRVDLADINGHVGNSSTQRTDLVAGAAKNIKFDFSDPNSNPYGSKLFDFYNGDFHGLANGRYADSQLKAGVAGKDSVIVKVKAQQFIPVRTDAICKIMFSIDDAALGTVDEAITVTISNLVIGNAANAKTFVPYTQENVDAGKIAFNPEKVKLATYSDEPKGYLNPVTEPTIASVASDLKVYPNPAKGQVTVNENVTITTLAGVATGIAGEGTLDISSLVAGSYLVVGTTATTTLVVE